MNKALRSLWKSKRTSITGAVTLALAGVQIYSDPASAATPATVAQIVTGLGLLLAEDSKTDQAEAPAEAEARERARAAEVKNSLRRQQGSDERNEP